MPKKGKNSNKVCTNSGDTTTQTEEKNQNTDTMDIDASNHQENDDVSDANLAILSGSDNEVDENEESEVDEEWELKKIMSVAAVTHPCPIKCSHETCNLVAATVWVSNQKPNENWYSCLDCQDTDFDGWPDLDELPVKHMSDELKKALIENCSKYKDCAMPDFELNSPTKCSTTSINDKHSPNTITPLPLSGTIEKQQESSVDGPCTVTPLNDTGEKKKGVAEVKPSKAQLEIHRKWQAAAEAAGGPNARIVLHKATAKTLIFDFLYDAFRPMNITEIHKGLKAIVPSPILKACLDDMALDNDFSTQFVDSDSEGDDDAAKKPRKVSDPLNSDNKSKHPLLYKGTKGSNSGLYYVNYNEAKGGSGLDREEKNQLAVDIANTNSKKENLQNSINTVRLVTTQLQSEPLNKDMNNLLMIAESEASDLSEKLVVARQYAVNEKDKEKAKKRINYFSSLWRKRRKLCMDFLLNMEELTEGTISAKSCLHGNGQIDIESDEAIVKLAFEFAKKKQSRITAASKNQSLRNKAIAGRSTPTSSENFVAVQLDSKGNVQRVYFPDDGISK